MGPLSTGSPTWDVILEVAIAVALVLMIVLLIRNYRGRR
jgi:low affinity Fe/Cu permease